MMMVMVVMVVMVVMMVMVAVMVTAVAGIKIGGPQKTPAEQPWHKINSFTIEYILYYSIGMGPVNGVYSVPLQGVCRR